LQRRVRLALRCSRVEGLAAARLTKRGLLLLERPRDRAGLVLRRWPDELARALVACVVLDVRKWMLVSMRQPEDGCN
jgi:hypothetical protein